jgi:hypothetical protein
MKHPLRRLALSLLVVGVVGGAPAFAAEQTIQRTATGADRQSTKNGVLAQSFQVPDTDSWLTGVEVALHGGNTGGTYRISLWQGAGARPGSKLENLTTWRNLTGGESRNEQLEPALEIEGGVEHFVVVEGTGTASWLCSEEEPSATTHTRISTDGGGSWEDIETGNCQGRAFALEVRTADAPPTVTTTPGTTQDQAGNTPDPTPDTTDDMEPSPETGDPGDSSKSHPFPGRNPNTGRRPTAPEVSKPATTEPATTRPTTTTPVSTSLTVGARLDTRELRQATGRSAIRPGAVRSLTPKRCRITGRELLLTRAGTCKLQFTTSDGRRNTVTLRVNRPA